MTIMAKGGIAYESRGEGLPFIALHGYSLDRRMSIGAFEPLFEDGGGTHGPGGRAYRRIYPDLPFMGESTDEPAGTGHDGILAALAAFVREVAPEGPILLAGESYGGYLARGLVREFGSRVEGLFLLCPAIVARRGDRDLPRPTVVREEEGWREAMRAAGATEADIACYEEHAVDRSAAAFERIRAEVIAGIRVARLSALDRYFDGSEAFSFDRMGKRRPVGDPVEDGAFDPLFDRPACFFLGRQDSSVGWRDALRLADRYPRASYHIVDAAGHNAQVEKPAAFASAFRAWLEACEKRP
jgi:pimeloyl-ACP methyl ester carboxylesterase